MKTQKIHLAVAMAAAIGVTTGVQAQSITIGISAEPSSVDPHYHNLGPNNSLSLHMFNALIGQDQKQNLLPALATSWKATGDTSWEFKLRKGVKFHDGSDFTANDFVYTACRVFNVPNSPSSFALYAKGIKSIDVVDDYTIVINTPKAYPLLPNDVSMLSVISATANGIDQALTFDDKGCGISQWPTTVGFNKGKNAVGTGPYKFDSYKKGDSLVMTRNDAYWGAAPLWSKVTFKPISNASSRVAALLAGDVDLIDKPPTQDLPRLKKNKDIEISKGLSNRVIYLHMDQYGPSTAGITGTGKPDSKYTGEGPCAERNCDKNPLLDKRVRQALSMAISRKAIVDKVMGDSAIAAAELLPAGFFGSNPGMQPEAYDPKKAKQLLAEAGYPNGFELTIGTPNDRYINDSKVAQAIAQMFTRIGIKTKVNAMTKSVFFKTRNKYEFSVYLAGWGAGTGEMSSPLRALVASRDKERGLGGTNRGRYSNSAIDDLIVNALSTVDDSKREALLQQASREAMADYAILPLHFEVTSWAHRKGVNYNARADQYTVANEITVTQ